MKKYVALRFVSFLYFALGAVALFAGLAVFGIAIFGHYQPDLPPADAANPYLVMAVSSVPYAIMFGGGLFMILGVGLIAMGEAIRVFMDIEENTRETKEEILALCKILKENQASALIP